MKQHFTIKVKPKAQARHRPSKYGGYYDPTSEFKKFIAMCVKVQRPTKVTEGPIRLSITFYMPRPKRLKKSAYWHTKKPDRDNLEKAICDALNGILWTDDAQICDGPIKKIYAPIGEEPRIEIEMEEIGE
jgi:Holliday junction resolvase RusA-like endonuclease